MMKRQRIFRRVCVTAVGLSILATAFLTPAALARTEPTAQKGDPQLTRPENPYMYDPSPLGVQGLGSDMGNAEEGTLEQGGSQIDSEVGAGERSVLPSRKNAPAPGVGTHEILAVSVIIASLAVIGLGIRFLFYPSSRVERVGGKASGDARG